MVTWISIESIIEISLVGLGLLLALYTIISNRLDDLQSYRTSQYIKLKKKEEYTFKKLNNNKRDCDLRDELNEVSYRIDNITSGLSYHYNMGYIVSGSLFMASIILSLVSTSSILLPYLPEYYLRIIQDYAVLSLFGGIVNFFYIWFKTMLDMRTLFVEKMEVAIESEKEEKIDKNDEMPEFLKNLNKRIFEKTKDISG